MAKSTGVWKSVEVKSYAEQEKYHLVVSGHVETLLALKVIPLMRDDMKLILRRAREGYMPIQSYGENGSNVRVFANEYVRILHITKRSSSEEIDVFSREQVCDVMLNDGWELVGFSSCSITQATEVTPGGLAVVERYTKKVQVTTM